MLIFLWLQAGPTRVIGNSVLNDRLDGRNASMCAIPSTFSAKHEDQIRYIFKYLYSRTDRYSNKETQGSSYVS